MLQHELAGIPVLHRSTQTARNWEGLNLIGRSPPFAHTLELIERWSTVDATVLITGETGTGKELAARAMHVLSRRREQRFVPVNCAAIPESLLEAELFGHVKGAFTDAKAASRGLIAQADGGTLFLDEVDSLSARAQAALLRFAQDRQYRSVGGSELVQADVRLIAATNSNLEARARMRQFREDLLYRLNLLTLPMPALRDRYGDALLLAQTFVRRLVAHYRTAPKYLNDESVYDLSRPHPWPGNVRELEHRVHRCFLMANGAAIDLGLATGLEERPQLAAATSFAAAKARVIAEFEARYVRELLERAKGNLSLAARLAGKERSRFGKLVRKYGVQRAAYEACEPPMR